MPASTQDSAPGFYNTRISILEAKSVNSLATLGDTNVGYKNWLESLEQIIAEIRPQLSAVLEFVRVKKPEKVTKEVFMTEFSQ